MNSLAIALLILVIAAISHYFATRPGPQPPANRQTWTLISWAFLVSSAFIVTWLLVNHAGATIHIGAGG